MDACTGAKDAGAGSGPFPAEPLIFFAGQRCCFKTFACYIGFLCMILPPGALPAGAVRFPNS